jgi:hypothetical protein
VYHTLWELTLAALPEAGGAAGADGAGGEAG